MVAGGDGKINEVINGLFAAGQLEQQPVVVGIPVGTGNDWARNRDLNLSISELSKKVAEPTYQTCDVGRVSAVQDVILGSTISAIRSVSGLMFVCLRICHAGHGGNFAARNLDLGIDVKFDNGQDTRQSFAFSRDCLAPRSRIPCKLLQRIIKSTISYAVSTLRNESRRARAASCSGERQPVFS